MAATWKRPILLTLDPIIPVGLRTAMRDRHPRRDVYTVRQYISELYIICTPVHHDDRDRQADRWVIAIDTVSRCR